jgi:hypothetical protein
VSPRHCPHGIGTRAVDGATLVLVVRTHVTPGIARVSGCRASVPLSRLLKHYQACNVLLLIHRAPHSYTVSRGSVQ